MTLLFLIRYYQKQNCALENHTWLQDFLFYIIEKSISWTVELLIFYHEIFNQADEALLNKMYFHSPAQFRFHFVNS